VAILLAARKILADNAGRSANHLARMIAMKRLLLCVVLLGGCKESAETKQTQLSNPHTAIATAPATQPRIKLDKKTTEFVARTRFFLDEARSAIRLVDIAPSPAEFRRKHEKVTDALTRIPEPPSPAFAEIPSLAKKVNLTFDLTGFYLKLADDMLRLKGAPNYDKNIGEAKKKAAEAKAILDEIEKLLPED
jgi:hypothetical protein